MRARVILYLLKHLEVFTGCYITVEKLTDMAVSNNQYHDKYNSYNKNDHDQAKLV